MATRPQAVRVPADADELTRRADMARAQKAQGAVAQTQARSAGQTVGSATMGEFEQARARLASNRPAGIADGLTTPQAPAAKPVAPSALSPDEVASFNRQSAGRFSQANPSAGPAVGGGREAIDAIKAQNRAAGPAPAGATSIADDLIPGASRPFAAGERAANTMRRVTGSGLGKWAGRAGTALAVGTEGVGVARVAADPNSTGADVATQAAEGAGKLAAAGLGAKAGAALGSFVGPVGTAVGGIAGGLAGYVGGEQLIEKGRELLGGTPDSPLEQIVARGKPAGVPAGTFDNVQSAVSTTESTPAGEAAARAQRQAANGGITPVADRTGGADEVLGTFNGKPITRASSDEMAARQSFGGPTTIAQGVAEPSYRAPSGGGFNATMPGGGSEDRAKDLLDSSTAAGRLYARLSADKTPTGKRVAAQFASEYMGTGTAERGQDAGLEEQALGANASLMRGREGDAAGLESARINSRSRGEYITTEDGSIGRISDGLLTPVTTADGKPAKGAKTKGAQPDSTEERIKTYLENIDPQGVMDVEERRAERQKYLQQLNEALGAGVNG